MAKSYPHMCQDDHVEIGHADSEHERCPVCRHRDVLMLVESFLDGWHMPDEECQREADSLLATVKECLTEAEPVTQ